MAKRKQLCGKLKAKNSDYHKKYRQSSKGKINRKRYKQSQEGKAAIKRYNQSSKAKTARRKYRQSLKGKTARRKYRQSLKGKTFKLKGNRRYDQTPKGKIGIQNRRSRHYLSIALKTKIPLANGWPDAGRVELKVGSDTVRLEQWRRAARLLSQGITLKLLFASSHESAVYDKHKLISFAEYAKKIGMSKEWENLVSKERKIMELKKEYTRCDQCGTHNPCGDECKDCGADLRVESKAA